LSLTPTRVEPSGIVTLTNEALLPELHGAVISLRLGILLELLDLPEPLELPEPPDEFWAVTDAICSWQGLKPYHSNFQWLEIHFPK
jgi:hypothetical protein